MLENVHQVKTGDIGELRAGFPDNMRLMREGRLRFRGTGTIFLDRVITGRTVDVLLLCG